MKLQRHRGDWREYDASTPPAHYSDRAEATVDHGIVWSARPEPLVVLAFQTGDRTIRVSMTAREAQALAARLQADAEDVRMTTLSADAAVLGDKLEKAKRRRDSWRKRGDSPADKEG